MFLEHKNSIREGEYLPLVQYNNKRVLVRDDTEFMVSNVCPHQGSIISTEQGTGNRVCPYHSWSFDLRGNPLTSGRTTRYCKNEKELDKFNVYSWNSLLFSVPVDFKVDVDFSNIHLVEKRIDVVSSSYKNIMDLFLDVDHIPGVHAGVYDRIGLENILSVDWTFYNNGSVQVVPDNNGNVVATWIALYPYTMIEWQPGALFVTVALPVAELKSNVYVFKYRDNTSDNNLWELNNSVWETAWMQDRTQAELLTDFATDNLEPQKHHFRSFLETYGTN